MHETRSKRSAEKKKSVNRRKVLYCKTGCAAPESGKSTSRARGSCVTAPPFNTESTGARGPESGLLNLWHGYKCLHQCVTMRLLHQWVVTSPWATDSVARLLWSGRCIANKDKAAETTTTERVELTAPHWLRTNVVPPRNVELQAWIASMRKGALPGGVTHAVRRGRGCRTRPSPRRCRACR